MEELRLRKSAKKDSMRIEKLVYDYYYTLIPPLDGFSIEEEMVCKKIVDKDGKIIAGCTGYIYPWGFMYIDDMWVESNYRNQGLGTLLLKHYERKAKLKGATKVVVEEVYDWNVEFFKTNGYKIAGEFPDLPKGHSFYILEKFF